MANSDTTGTIDTHLHYEIRAIPIGGPGPADPGFDPALKTYVNSCDPLQFMWPDLTPPPGSGSCTVP